MVWKFQYFSITQILREINFGESSNSNSAIFAILGVLNFVYLVDFSLQKVKNSMNLKFRASEFVKIQILRL